MGCGAIVLVHYVLVLLNNGYWHRQVSNAETKMQSYNAALDSLPTWEMYNVYLFAKRNSHEWYISNGDTTIVDKAWEHDFLKENPKATWIKAPFVQYSSTWYKDRFKVYLNMKMFDDLPMMEGNKTIGIGT